MIDLTLQCGGVCEKCRVIICEYLYVNMCACLCACLYECICIVLYAHRQGCACPCAFVLALHMHVYSLTLRCMSQSVRKTDGLFLVYFSGKFVKGKDILL